VLGDTTRSTGIYLPIFRGVVELDSFLDFGQVIHMPSTKSLSENRITLKEAAQIAENYFSELYPRLQRPMANVMLEEVEEIDDGANWLITLGYDLERKSNIHPQSALAFGQPLSSRQYKVVKIDAKTGRVRSMKIRSVK
jgi:hypothetical protein